MHKQADRTLKTDPLSEQKKQKRKEEVGVISLNKIMKKLGLVDKAKLMAYITKVARKRGYITIYVKFTKNGEKSEKSANFYDMVQFNSFLQNLLIELKTKKYGNALGVFFGKVEDGRDDVVIHEVKYEDSLGGKYVFPIS